MRLVAIPKWFTHRAEEMQLDKWWRQLDLVEKKEIRDKCNLLTKAY